MGAITLPNFRTTADVRMNTKLKDGGVYIEWSSLTEVKAWIWSDAQKALAGRVDVSVDTGDATVLKCLYASTKPQYPGVNRLIVQGRYNGSLKTYDKPVFNFVPRTAEATGSITISDPEVDVEIEVTDTTSSILDNTIAAALAAAAHAEHAASLVPLQVLQDCEAATAVALTAASKAPVIGENGNWWVWNSSAGEYQDTGKVARGATGNGIASWSVVESQEDDGENVVTVTFTDGEQETFTVKNGKTGNGIASIVQTYESPDDAGTNVITVTMTNGTVITFNVKNGSKGRPGAAQAAYKSVEELPTASADTMDKIYLTPTETSGVYNMSYTDYDGTSYSWVALGTSAIQLSDYATKTELSQLEEKVDENEIQSVLLGGRSILKPLNNASDITNMILGYYYKPDGSFASQSGFKYQKVTVNHSKAYRIENNVPAAYAISNLVFFDNNDNVIYKSGVGGPIDVCFSFPTFVKAFGTCGVSTSVVKITEGDVASQVGSEQMAESAAEKIVVLSQVQNALETNTKCIMPISRKDIKNLVSGYYDASGAIHESSSISCQSITIDHSKAYHFFAGTTNAGYRRIMFLDSANRVVYSADGAINASYLFQKGVKKVLVNIGNSETGVEIDELLYADVPFPVSEDKTIFFDKTRNIFTPEFVAPGLLADGDNYPSYTSYKTYFRIPASPNKTYKLSSNGVAKNFTRVRSLDSTGAFISGSYSASVSSYTTPENTAFVEISLSASLTEKLQLEENSVTPYVYPWTLKDEYLAAFVPTIPDGSITRTKIQDSAVSLEKTNFASLGKNLFDADSIVTGILSNGAILSNYTNYRVSALIPVEPSTTYRVSVDGVADRAAASRIAEYDAEGNVVYSSDSYGNSTIVTDEDAAFLRISFSAVYIPNYQKIQVEKGEYVTSFLPYGYYIDKDVLPEEEAPILISNGVEISLPDKIYAVVGDTLQLFYNGMIKAVDPFVFNILVNCSKGAMYPRYWEYTPKAADVGTITFTLKVLDNNRNVIAQKNTTIVTSAAPSSPSSDVHILTFGDSLTAGGYWPHECDRRLTGTGGSPEGKGLNNITFCGSKTKDGTHYHGGSGWTWTSYTTSGHLAFRFVLSGSPQLAMGSVYSNNGHQYQIVEIIDGTILGSVVSDGTPTKIENADHYAPQASGTLTKVSGDGDSSVQYASNSVDSANPLWDNVNEKMSFVPYAENYCGGQIDIVYVFLTWNSPMGNWKSDFSDMLAQLDVFANTLHAEFPNAKLKVMAVQFPSIKRAMPDYGASGAGHSDVYGMLVSVFNMNKAYQDWCNMDEHSAWCEFVNVSSQFDSDYCMNIIEKNVNTRSTLKEYVVYNGVHPSQNGYMQIADVVYRNIVATIGE